ncbi:MAG: cohesin domain-containing protein [Candidatus Paceibacterota bacterium]
MFKRNNKTKYLLAVILLVITSLVFTNKIYAASLSILPSPTTVSVGNIVSVRVLVNTEGKSVNNGEATIQFPVDMLEVVSITKGSSIFTLWVEEPKFSNTTGKISFNGGVPNPGFTGASGYIATVTFKAKKQGTASVIFSDGAVRENDGLGTDILTSKNSGTIQIGIQKEIEIPIVSNNGTIPVKPIILSETHSNSEFWYSSNTATFNWKIPSGITSLKTLFNKVAISNPTISYDNSVTQKTLNNISDGVSYFHLQYFNLAGASSIAHYKVNVDSTAPLAFTPTIRNADGQNLVKLNAEDATSGIDYYMLGIDNGSSFKVQKDDLLNSEYNLPIQKEGNHNLKVIAYDKAGNKTQSSTMFTSSPVTIPILSLSSSEIITGESVTILGKTDYPNNQVNVILESDGKEIKRYTQTTSQDGNFSVTTDKIKTIGSISIWAENIFTDSLKSEPSQKVYLKVNQTDVVKITLAIFYPLLGIILIILLLLILIIILYLGWHKYFGLKKKIEKESKEMTIEVHKAMLLLKEELNDQLKSLEKIKIDRSLNEKEEIIFNEIKDNIDGIDDFVEKKLKKFM